MLRLSTTNFYLDRSVHDADIFQLFLSPLLESSLISISVWPSSTLIIISEDQPSYYVPVLVHVKPTTVAKPKRSHFLGLSAAEHRFNCLFWSFIIF